MLCLIVIYVPVNQRVIHSATTRTGQEEVLESLSSSAGHHERKPAGSYPGGEEQKKKN